MKNSYAIESEKDANTAVVAVAAGGHLSSKMIYFIAWKPQADTSLLRQSIQKFISDTIDKAVNENYQSIAFPAIGCGQFGCSPSLIAEFMVGEVFRRLATHPIWVTFVIEPDKTNVYDEFRKRLDLFKSTRLDAVLVVCGKGMIEVEKGDITKQKVFKKSPYKGKYMGFFLIFGRLILLLATHHRCF